MWGRMRAHAKRVFPMCGVGLAAVIGYVYFQEPHLWTLGNFLLAAGGILGLGVFMVMYEEFVARHIVERAQKLRDKNRRT